MPKHLEESVKKTASFGLALLICIAIMSMPISTAFACGKAGCDPATCTKAKTCPISKPKACSGHGLKSIKAEKDNTDGTLAGSNDGLCTKTNCQDITLAISGMTCTGCEGIITKALVTNENVFKVESIDYKTGLATICCSKDKIGGSDLINMIASAGYKAVISTAVSKLEINDKETEKASDTKTDY
jgi:copper chaperone CopZ